MNDRETAAIARVKAAWWKAEAMKVSVGASGTEVWPDPLRHEDVGVLLEVFDRATTRPEGK